MRLLVHQRIVLYEIIYEVSLFKMHEIPCTIAKCSTNDIVYWVCHARTGSLFKLIRIYTFRIYLRQWFIVACTLSLFNHFSVAHSFLFLFKGYYCCHFSFSIHIAITILCQNITTCHTYIQNWDWALKLNPKKNWTVFFFGC